VSTKPYTQAIRPSTKLLKFVGGWALLALLLSALRIRDGLEATWIADATALWWSLGLIILVMSIIDLRRQRDLSGINIHRSLPDTLALGVHKRVQISIDNPYPYTLIGSFTELYPDALQAPRLPLDLTLKPDAQMQLTYPVLPIRRGACEFIGSQLRLDSSWQLWQRLITINEVQQIKVYPNFSPIVRNSIAGIESQQASTGDHSMRKRGEGMEFHQLREFRPGDAIRQIDWKASSRYRKPISRDYQDERDQDVLFLLDCGRRLHHRDGQLSHFDYSLNALLLTAFVALKQGDAAGLMSFAGDPRWLSPIKGRASINTLLNQLYDLHSSTQTSDFLEAAKNLTSRYRKRSLIIIISNIRDEDSEDLLAATRLLTKRHVVVIANMQEDFLSQTLNEPVQSFNQALNYCSTNTYMRERKKLHSHLQKSGVILVDALPSQLHTKLAHEYLRIKRSGIL